MQPQIQIIIERLDQALIKAVFYENICKFLFSNLDNQIQPKWRVRFSYYVFPKNIHDFHHSHHFPEVKNENGVPSSSFDIIVLQPPRLRGLPLDLLLVVHGLLLLVLVRLRSVRGGRVVVHPRGVQPHQWKP